MQPQEMIAELEVIKNELLNSSNKYRCHYPIERRYERLIERFEVEKGASEVDKQRYKTLKSEIKAKLQDLRKANETMINQLDFDAECKRLIDAGDQVNLKGLVNIGEYFGVEAIGGSEISEALDYVLRPYQLGANLRTPKNKICLDYLCNLLGHSILELPTNTQTSSTSSGFPFKSMYSGVNTQFVSTQDKIKEILEGDDTTKLMVWLLNASVEDRHYALRVASSKEGSFDCLRFLLLRAKPENNDINILTQGKPSLQCAMHRAIQSGSAVIVGAMLNGEINQSDDLLRQLLVRDSSNLTPIDYLEKIKNTGEYRSIVRTIRNAVDKYQTDSRLALSIDEAKSVSDKLTTFLSSAPNFAM